MFHCPVSLCQFVLKFIFMFASWDNPLTKKDIQINTCRA